MEPCSDPKLINPLERWALEQFYQATGGAAGKWRKDTGWLHGSPCDWHGVDCDIFGDHCGVESLELPYNQLEGPIPSCLTEHLVYLWNLKLDGNALTGHLPDLPPKDAGGSGVHVNLEHNRILGALPRAWAASPKMVTLILAFNQLSGQLPEDWRKSIKLKYLDLRRNHLSGDLVSWGLPPSLRYLYLQGNDFSGALPDEWAMSSLEIVLMGENRITGALPIAWGNFSTLRGLALQKNQLKGDATAAFQSWTGLKLQTLILSDNQLSGCLESLPPALLEAPKTTNATLLLFGNHFSCALPWAPQANLTALVLPGNRFALGKVLGPPWYEQEVHSPLASSGTVWPSIAAVLPILLLLVELAVRCRRRSAQTRIRGVFLDVLKTCGLWPVLDSLILVAVMSWSELRLYSCPPGWTIFSFANLRLDAGRPVLFYLLSFYWGASTWMSLRSGMLLRGQNCHGAAHVGCRGLLPVSALIFITVFVNGFFALAKSIPEENSIGITPRSAWIVLKMAPAVSFATREAAAYFLAYQLPEHSAIQGTMLLIATLTGWAAPMLVTGLMDNSCVGSWRWLWSKCSQREAEAFDIWCNGQLVVLSSEICGVPAAASSSGSCSHSMVEVMLHLLLPKLSLDAAFQLSLLFWGRLVQSHRLSSAKAEAKAMLKIQNAVQIAMVFGTFMPIIYAFCLLNMGAHMLKLEAVQLPSEGVHDHPAEAATSFEIEESLTPQHELDFMPRQLMLAGFLRAILLLLCLWEPFGWQAVLCVFAGVSFGILVSTAYKMLLRLG